MGFYIFGAHTQNPISIRVGLLSLYSTGDCLCIQNILWRSRGKKKKINKTKIIPFDNIKKYNHFKINVNFVTIIFSEFAWNFYKKLSSVDGVENIFFSPYSISTALAMTSRGAQGDTLTEMNNVRFVILSSGKQHTSFEQIK